MAKYNFNLRKKKSQGATPINLIVRWDNKKLVYSTKESIEPKFFETDRNARNFQRAKETRQNPGFTELNARLDWIEANAKTVFRKFLNDNDNRSPQPEELKYLLDIKLRNVPERQRKSFLSFFEQYIEESKTRFNSTTGKLLAHGTVKVYMNTLVNLKEYVEVKKKRIDWDTIDLNFYHDYVEFLSKEKNHSNNTVGRHIKTIKAVLNEATERGLNQHFAFKSKRFRKISEETDSIYLNEEELNQLFALDLGKNKRLEQVRDLFLVGCWTGLRFSDFVNIEAKSFKGDFLEIKTKKTDQVVIVPINKVVKEIMARYEGVFPNSLPPAISNPKINKYLKEIGKLLPTLHVFVEVAISKGGLQQVLLKRKYELIVSHTARRSFATNLYKDGLPSITIMKITGHRTERAFLRYIKITLDQHAKLLQEHWHRKQELNEIKNQRQSENGRLQQA